MREGHIEHLSLYGNVEFIHGKEGVKNAILFFGG